MDPVTTMQTLTAFIGVLGALWSAFKGTEWYDKHKEKREVKAFDFVLDAVDAVFRDYVAQAKAKNPDGKLSVDQQNIARSRAWTLAQKLAGQAGFATGFSKVITEANKDRFIAQAVKILKYGL